MVAWEESNRVGHLPYLYPGTSDNGEQAFDGPAIHLATGYATGSINFSANMFLMWQSNAVANSIPVPAAYVN